MPIDRYRRYKNPSDFTREFREELRSSMQELSETSFRGFQQTGSRKARALSRERLPSGGESYAKTIHTEESQTYGKWGGRIYSDHEWAEAIEYGTEPHEIVSKEYAFNKGKKKPEYPIYHGTRAGEKVMREGLKTQQEKYDPSRRKGTIDSSYSTLWGSSIREVSESYAERGSESVRFTMEAAGKSEKEIKEWARKQGKPTVFEMEGREIAKKRWPDLPEDKAEKMLKMYNQANLDLGMSKIPPEKLRVSKPTPLGIKKHLPNYTGKATPWGTRYVDDKVYFNRVQHPGARAFYIFRDTLEYLREQSDNILDRALRRVGFG